MPDNAERDGRERGTEHDARGVRRRLGRATGQNDDSQGTISDAAVTRTCGGDHHRALGLGRINQRARWRLRQDTSDGGNGHDDANTGRVPLPFRQQIDGKYGPSASRTSAKKKFEASSAPLARASRGVSLTITRDHEPTVESDTNT